MAKAKRKADGAEYILHIGPIYSEREQKYKTRFTLETTKLFASFRYDLSFKEQLDGKVLRYKILGLKPPHLSLPAAGRAQFTREYDNLRGKYDVMIEGLDGRVNTFSVRITAKKIQLLKAPTSHFVDIIVDEAPSSTN
jgi:hypothetical protein